MDSLLATAKPLHCQAVARVENCSDEASRALKQRITMRNYFPRGRGFCTKVPVRMVLRKVSPNDPDLGMVYLKRMSISDIQVAPGMIDVRREQQSIKTFPPDTNNLPGRIERPPAHRQS